MLNKRKVFDVDTKENIINDYNNRDNNKLTVEEIMKKYDIKASSTFYTIVNPKNQEKIKQVIDTQMRPPTSKRIKVPVYPEVDKAMEIWFRESKTHKNIVIDGPIMQEQAKKFAQYFNYDDFKASTGWLEKFKTRMNISYKKNSWRKWYGGF